LRDLFDTRLRNGVLGKDGNAGLECSFEKDILPTIKGPKLIASAAALRVSHLPMPGYPIATAREVADDAWADRSCDSPRST
jgi:hypothetical protein